jgi:xanthine dehydrogenase YagS FAD-binding subunit
LGGVAPFPFRARSAEDELEGREITNESIEKAANLVSLKSQPLKMNAYKVKLIKSVVKRALQKVSRSSGERL